MLKMLKKSLSDLEILIGELEGYEKSLNFNMKGYTQKLPDGTEHFCCMVCGHSPKLLLERLKNIAGDVKDA
jgi:hypothetical protein